MGKKKTLIIVDFLADEVIHDGKGCSKKDGLMLGYFLWLISKGDVAIGLETKKCNKLEGIPHSS